MFCRQHCRIWHGVQLKFASYNIRKAIGLDRQRDPERILSVLHEIDADVVALQECDRRLGRRETAIPRLMIEDHHWQIVPVAIRPLSIGWHGNALLVRRGIDILNSAIVELPRLEPRGAVRADLGVNGQRVRVVGMHLDLSGFRRRDQVQTILHHVSECPLQCPTVLMGDMNEWSAHGGCFRAFEHPWQLLTPGATFPTQQPVARLDRFAISAEWHCLETDVHHSALSARGSDHFPIWAKLALR